MSYNIIDILVIEWGANFVTAVSDAGVLSPDQMLEVAEIATILDSLPVISDDNRLDALKSALEEIESRV